MIVLMYTDIVDGSEKVPTICWRNIGMVHKGQLISKAKFSFAPKTEQKYFCISALALYNGSNEKNKGKLLYYMTHNYLSAW